MEFKEYKLADITKKIYSGGTPSTKESSYWNGDLKWLSSGETSNRFIMSTEKTITQKGVENSSTKLAFKHDLVMASAGQGYTRGQTSFLKIDTYINQSLIAISVNKNEIHPLYLFYNLVSRYNELRQISDSSSTRGSINTKMIKNLNIMIPEKSYQNRIVYLINSIDEKIEINKKIIENLEELSQTLYKRWFVDFEFPDANGNPYKTSGGEMVDSELGNIPKLWNIKRISDICDVTDGTHDSPKQTKEGYPLVTSKHLNKFDINFSTTKLISKEDFISINQRSKVDKNDILLSMIGTIGKIHFVNSKTINYAIKNVGLIKTSQIYFSTYIYNYINSQNTMDYIRQRTSGSTQQYISLGSLRSIPIVLPENNILKAYIDINNNFFRSINQRNEENVALIQLRDTLLPKLMSGEIELPDDIEVNEDELSI
ncbi:restriction endonuclease subunit S [Mammaliicoccus sciuri]|uniref:restriction endonuclease subunit S n=1 Tax=Mammaliicoccus sciuri TaxID=1296 RepID=UPI002737A486|nr:restriction endonuclease subunit S [Mammaliicoccus sciuri]